MKTTLTELSPIPVEFVVGHALAKATGAQRKPYVELIQSWADHENMVDEGLSVVRRLSDKQHIDADHMPKEFYMRYRSGERAQQLINIIQEINEVIQSGEEMWTWAHVMRVMVDESILMANVSNTRFDAIICSIIPDKGIDTVRKNGDFTIMKDRNDSHHLWVSNRGINPVQATNREICKQIVERFTPILTRTNFSEL